MSDSKQQQLRREQRRRYLKNLIKEAVLNILVEQQPIVPTSAVPPAAPPVAPETNNTETLTPDPQMEQQPEQFTVELMVDKLNVLRGGRSFTDPEVFGRLTGLFNNLTDEQKGNLEHLLSELGKAVIGATEEEAGLDDGQQSGGPAQAPPPAAAPAPPMAAPSGPVAPSM